MAGTEDREDDAKEQAEESVPVPYQVFDCRVWDSIAAYPMIVPLFGDRYAYISKFVFTDAGTKQETEVVLPLDGNIVTLRTMLELHRRHLATFKENIKLETLAITKKGLLQQMDESMEVLRDIRSMILELYHDDSKEA